MGYYASTGVRWSMDPVEAVTKSRLKALQGREKTFIFEDDYMDTEVGMRGLIRISRPNGDIAGLEFIEPEEFWMDPDAVEEYKDTLAEGYHVTVIVPTAELEDARDLLQEEAGSGVVVLGYDEVSSPLGL